MRIISQFALNVKIYDLRKLRKIIINLSFAEFDHVEY